jgi:hypothetical protein
MEKLNIDCLILIFNELRGDRKTLYSCLIVNKEWCHLVVPILWRKYPYFFDREKPKEKFYNIILSCLPTSSKKLLIDNNIRLPSTFLSKSLTFNYVSFCKFLRFGIIDNIINVVFKEEIINKVNNYSKKRNLLEQEIYKLFISQCKNIKELEWKTSQPLPSFPEALTCFSQLYSLNIDLHYVKSYLYEMSQICKDLGELIINGCSQDIPGLISLIDAQRNLKRVTLSSLFKEGTCEEISKALARKGSTINDLSLYGPIGVISHSFLTSLINLKDLRIYHYDWHKSYEGIKEFQKYLAISKFPELQSLDISEDLLCIKELATLIENTKGDISYISVYISDESAENSVMLLQAISNHCPKIEYLDTFIESKDLKFVKSLLINCLKLERLCLNSLNEIDDIGDELLDILTKFSPISLTDITISGNWEYSIGALEIFFESYRDRKLRDFDINDYNGRRITNEHVDIVKKYYDEGIILSSNLLDL